MPRRNDYPGRLTRGQRQQILYDLEMDGEVGEEVVRHGDALTVAMLTTVMLDAFDRKEQENAHA
jgi:hypothetical protein